LATGIYRWSAIYIWRSIDGSTLQAAQRRGRSYILCRGR